MDQKIKLALLLFFLLPVLPFNFQTNQIVSASEVTIKEDVEIWNERYSSKEFLFGTKPLKFLKQKMDLLPKGKAFVIAMGEGRNAVYLAKNGYEVEGCDISDAAIEKANKLADKKGVKINAFVTDMETYKIKPDKYDLITCFYYLQRDLMPQIIKGLRKGGMVIIETYSIDQLTLGPDVKGPRNEDYLLKHNELLNYFRELRVIYYEETIIGNEKAIARLIAEKP